MTYLHSQYCDSLVQHIHKLLYALQATFLNILVYLQYLFWHQKTTKCPTHDACTKMLSMLKSMQKIDTPLKLHRQLQSIFQIQWVSWIVQFISKINVTNLTFNKCCITFRVKLIICVMWESFYHSCTKFRSYIIHRFFCGMILQQNIFHHWKIKLDVIYRIAN